MLLILRIHWIYWKKKIDCMNFGCSGEVNFLISLHIYFVQWTWKEFVFGLGLMYEDLNIIKVGI